MAVDAVAGRLRRARAAQQPAARLAPQPIVGDGDGAGVDERRHDAPVRAGEHAGLFAEAGEDHVEHEAEDDDRREPGQVLDGGSVTIAASSCRPMIQARNTLAMTNDRPKKTACFSPVRTSRSLVHGPRLPAQLLLRGSLEQVLQLAEQHLHEHRLRAQPAAPDPADRHGAEREGDQHGQRDEHDQVKVLRPEEHAEQHEPPLQHVQHHQRLAADVDERRGEEKGEEEPRSPPCVRDRSGPTAAGHKSTSAARRGPRSQARCGTSRALRRA